MFNYIQYLPDEILNIIWNYLNPIHKIFINKDYYNKFNYLIDNLISKGRYESYIRDVVRNDSNFIFKNILNRQFNNWLQISDYKYNNIIYSNYILFLLFFSNKNNSNKCNNQINLQLQLSGLKKNWYKNNRIKYNQWSN